MSSESLPILKKWDNIELSYNKR